MISVIINGLVPFLLAINVHVPNNTLGLSNIDPEYTYNLHKTFVVHRDPIQTTEYNATVSCYFYQSNSLYCLLHHINVFATVTHVDNITREVTKEQLDALDWFQIKFNDHGVEEILVNKTTNKKDIIKDIANLFDIGNNLTNKVSLSNSNFIAREKTVVGTCLTTYNISAIYERQKIDKINEENNISFHIMLLEIAKLHLPSRVNETNLHVFIEKNRNHCYSWDFSKSFPGIEVSKYVHTMKMINDEFEMFSLMDGRFLPDTWNPLGTPLFRETMLLKLTNIKVIKYIEFKSDDYIWTNIR